MDLIDSMRVLDRVIERRSFSAAATDLGLSRSTVTQAIQQLEARLGARLLERNTRHVLPTLDGAAYHRRCVSILADLEDAENALSSTEPRGRLRIDVNGKLARHFLLPHLPTFMARYTGIELHIGEGDRLVDLVREGVDCVVRAGHPQDSSMVARHLGQIAEVTCASPAYLARHGTPTSLEALAGHAVVGFVSSATGEVMPLRFIAGAEVQAVPLPARITVNGGATMEELARLGFGLIQAPRFALANDLRDGRLVELLAGFPPPALPLIALYPQSRHLAPRVRVFVDWLAAIFAGRDVTAALGAGP